MPLNLDEIKARKEAVDVLIARYGHTGTVGYLEGLLNGILAGYTPPTHADVMRVLSFNMEK
jgi:hypothetical protein